VGEVPCFVDDLLAVVGHLAILDYAFLCESCVFCVFCVFLDSMCDSVSFLLNLCVLCDLSGPDSPSRL
jgi:hypothetical protein